MDSNRASFHSTWMVAGKAIGFAELESTALRFESEQKLEQARDAFDAALRLNPSSQPAVEGRARIAIRLREDNATEHCARALAFRNDDPELQAQMIAVAVAELGRAAAPLLEDFLERNPLNTGSQELLAELRAQSGAGDGFVAGYHSALSQYPECRALLMSYWHTLSRARRYDEALESIDANRSLFDDDRDFAMLEVAIASHSGQTDRTGKLLERLDKRPDAQLARGQHRLQTGDPGEAASLLQTVVAQQPDNLEAWSLLELAWRMIKDPRHQWLAEPGLYGATELELSGAQLADIAAVLRTMHRASAEPIGQSVRGGTQTSGQLFLRHEPEIALLAKALAAAIRQFVGNLPPADPGHPLLKHRNMGMAFGPSWSVRFTGSGHHAAHFHPGGILSSACYISVPAEIAGSGDREGWLEIGRPPPELGLDILPLATFEPKPGRLVLFPSFLFHGTRPFTGGERLTVAFDLVPVPPR